MNGPRQFSFANAAQGGAPGAMKADFGANEASESNDEERDEPKRKPKTVERVVTSKNVVKLAKARLREVKNELRRMKALETERAELQRLIAAAEDKPRAQVREIKRSAG